IRADNQAIYPRSSRLMRWLEQSATWCCDGWRSGNPRFSRIVGEANRMFSEALPNDAACMEFQGALLRLLWERRDSTLSLHDWLGALRQELLVEVLNRSRTLVDESEKLDDLILKTAPGEPHEEMSLGQFCGHGNGNNRINLTTLHSSKGREFRVVVMFGMDEGGIPRRRPSERDIREARRLFYVGFTRAEEEIHIVCSKSKASRFAIELAQRLNEQ
ncbi:MAG: 3'-5' exonuclease, partial [Pseudomonadota bacterium]